MGVRQKGERNREREGGDKMKERAGVREIE